MCTLKVLCSYRPTINYVYLMGICLYNLFYWCIKGKTFLKRPLTMDVWIPTVLKFRNECKEERLTEKISALLTWCWPSGRSSFPKTDRQSSLARCLLHYTTVCQVSPDPTSTLQSLAAGAWRTAVKVKLIHVVKQIFSIKGQHLLCLLFEWLQDLWRSRFCDE